MKSLNVLFVTSEIAPWVKTGGLGDVAAALPPALRALGHDVRVLVPYYPALRAAFPPETAPILATFGDFSAGFPGSALREVSAPDGTPLLLLDCSHCFDRPGNPYLDANQADWPDNHIRFGLLSRLAAWFGSADNHLSWHPDVIHCNDWQSGLAPAYLQQSPGPIAKSIITVHNLAFQGCFDPGVRTTLGLSDAVWHMAGVEYYGNLSFMKAGLAYADAITTVSPTYAREIQTEQHGMGFAGLLQHRSHSVHGILNGIDTRIWNPTSDALVPFHYSAKNLAGKAQNKAALQAQMGLEVTADIPLLGVISRLTYQKGLDLVPAIEEFLLSAPAQLAVLGSGEPALEAAFRAMAERHPHQCALKLGFDESLAHRIEAGADIFLMPSRFEPCGLNQMFSLHYGTPPVVRSTGGLADTVSDMQTGFSFGDADVASFLGALERALVVWRNPSEWRAMIKRGMALDFSWTQPAKQYSDVFASLLFA